MVLPGSSSGPQRGKQLWVSVSDVRPGTASSRVGGDNGPGAGEKAGSRATVARTREGGETRPQGEARLTAVQDPGGEEGSGT